MNGFRISVKELLAAVALTAVAVAALVNASRVWLGIIGLLTIVFSLTAIVAAICGRGSRRGFWIGCSVFALGYLFFVFSPSQHGWDQWTFLSDKLLRWCHEAIASEVELPRLGPAPPPIDTPGAFGRLPPPVSRVQTPDWGDFRWIGQHLVAWLFGAVGGLVGSYFYTPTADKRNQGTQR